MLSTGGDLPRVGKVIQLAVHVMVAGSNASTCGFLLKSNFDFPAVSCCSAETSVFMFQALAHFAQVIVACVEPNKSTLANGDREVWTAQRFERPPQALTHFSKETGAIPQRDAVRRPNQMHSISA